MFDYNFSDNNKNNNNQNQNTTEIIRKSEDIVSRWVTEGLKPKEEEQKKDKDKEESKNIYL